MSAAANRLGLAAGLVPGVAVLILPAPEGLTEPAWIALGLALAMAAWWVTEALPLAVTALVPLAVFPLTGLGGMAEVAASYSHPLIILFLGGFLFAKGIERWGLHVALATRLVQLTGGGAGSVVGGLMAATAFLSLWISNTAATMVMAPIAAAMAASCPDDDQFAAAALLGVAFAATIGGMGSLLGTPPNALFAAYLSETHGVVIGFAEWAAIGLPVTLTMLPVTWLLLTRVVFRPMQAALASPERAEPLDTPARRVAILGALAAAALVLRPALDAALPDGGLTDAGIALGAALLLFVLPDGSGGRLLGWDQARDLRWDVLILFGGGLALAGAIDRTGLAAWLAELVSSLRAGPVWALVLLFAIAVVLIGELASNTAMAAIFLPVAGATAAGLGLDVLAVTVPIALAASVGFMLPVATPPNAIVFAYPGVTRARMLRAGAGLDVIGVLLAVGAGLVLGPLVLGK